MSKRRVACVLGLALTFGSVSAVAALEPGESVTTVHGLVLGPVVHEESLSFAAYVDQWGNLHLGGACRVPDAEGTYGQVTASNLGGGAPQVVLGAPGSAPSVVKRNGSTIGVWTSTCQETLPVEGTYDVSGPEFAGLTWEDFATFRKFSDGTVLYPARTNGTGHWRFWALDPAVGAPSLLFDAAELPITEAFEEVWGFYGATVTPDDRIWMVIQGQGNARSTGIVAIARDGEVEVVRGPEAWGASVLNEGEYAQVAYYAPLDAVLVGTVKAHDWPWYDYPLIGVFPQGNPGAWTAARPPFVRFDAFDYEVEGKLWSPGHFNALVPTEGGELMIAFEDGMRPLEVAPALMDADRDLVSLADEEAAGTSDFELPEDNSYVPWSLAPSTAVQQLAWVRGDPFIEGEPGGTLWCRTKPAVGVACVNSQGAQVVPRRVGQPDEIPAPEHSPVPSPEGRYLYTFDQDTYDQRNPPEKLMRLDLESGAWEEFAALVPAGSWGREILPLDEDTVLVAQTGPTSAYSYLVRYALGEEPWIVIHADRHDCPLASNQGELDRCADPVAAAADPIIRRVRAIEGPGLVSFELMGFDPANEAVIFLAFSGSGVQSFLFSVGRGDTRLLLDGLDIDRDIRLDGGFYYGSPHDPWYVGGDYLLGATLRPRVDISANAAGATPRPRGWFGRGLLQEGVETAFEWVEVDERLLPGEVVFSSAGALMRVNPDEGVAGWMSPADFEARVDEAGLASLEAEGLGDMDHIAARSDGGALCMVERLRGRVWEVALDAGLVSMIALVEEGDEARACAYDDEGRLVMLAPGVLRLPGSEVSLGLTEPVALVRLPDGWLVGEAGAPAVCATDGGSVSALDFEVATIARPVPENVVWADGNGHFYAAAATSVCGLSKPERMCTGAEECDGRMVAGRQLAARADGVAYIGGERLRLPFPETLPGAFGWYRPISRTGPRILATPLTPGGLDEIRGAAALPGGTFPTDYARVGEGAFSEPEPSPDPPPNDDGPPLEPPVDETPEEEATGCGSCGGGASPDAGGAWPIAFAALWLTAWSRRRGG